MPEAPHLARDRLAFYRESLSQLLKTRSNASARRQQHGALLAEETANALKSWWFEILGNWLLLRPEQSSLRAIQEVWLPQILHGQKPKEFLQIGIPGWQYTRVQRAHLTQEKGEILAIKYPRPDII